MQFTRFRASNVYCSFSGTYAEKPPLLLSANLAQGPVGVICRFCQVCRNMESITYVVSRRGDVPSPVVPAILFNLLDRIAKQKGTTPAQIALA